MVSSGQYLIGRGGRTPGPSPVARRPGRLRWAAAAWGLVGLFENQAHEVHRRSWLGEWEIALRAGQPRHLHFAKGRRLQPNSLVGSLLLVTGLRKWTLVSPR